MAKVFISYSHEDRELVSAYASHLKSYGHDVYWEGTMLEISEEYEVAIQRAIRSADVILSFLTTQAVVSKHVKHEYDIARNLALKGDKLLVCLVGDGLERTYEPSEAAVYININGRSVEDKIAEVSDVINDYMRDRGKSEKDVVYTPAKFAKELHDALVGQPHGDIKGWRYSGITAKVYGTPGGDWGDTNGFEFENGKYSFILRSIWNAGNDGKHSYLVVESNNLEGQLANVALDNTNKFVNKNGKISIYETYDMTIGGYGRITRKDVRAAFEQAGMRDNVITSFNESIILWIIVVLDILRWATYREEAKKILMNPDKEEGSIIKKPNYWLLKIYGANWEWDMKNMRKGLTGYFNSHFNSRERRPEYELFTQIKAGDKGVAYDYSGARAVVFFFDVSSGLINTKRREEVFTFTVTHVLDEAIIADNFVDMIDFSHELDETSIRKLFRLSYDAYLYIVSLRQGGDSVAVDTSLLSASSLLTTYSTDRVGKPDIDRLGFMDDVVALASVMVYKEVQPPLAIGLFGNWGTGKSFFISKLREKVKEFSVDSRDVFCENVLQIDFNSWHYSDSNLWASLITKIFEDLKKHGDKEGGNAFENMMSKLNSTREMIEEAKEQKALVDSRIEELENRKKIQDDYIRDKQEELETIKLKDIFHQVIEDPLVRQDIEKLDEDFSLWKLREQRDNIDNAIEELQDFGKDIGTTYKLARYVSKNNKRFTVTIIVLLIALAIMVSPFYVAVLKSIIAKVGVALTGILTALSGLIVYLKPYRKQLKGVLARLKGIKGTITSLEAQAAKTMSNKQEKINKSIEKATDVSKEIQKNIDQLTVKEKRLKKDISEITSGKKILHFIESRVSDERYTNSLGIISWIRKDFEQLNKLLYEKNEALAKIDAQDGNEDEFKLDRIILFIDDLDRCNEKIVVQVLEAIHLLLAFPLFVVVVGVDPRWMHNALKTKYMHLKKNKKNNVAQTDGSILIPAEEINAATTYDYMEKIFQIPFTLKPMSEEGKHDLIMAQFEGQPEAPIAASEIDIITEDGDLIMTEEGDMIVAEHDLVDEMPELTEQLEIEVIENKVDVKTLQVTDKEIAFMQAIAAIIGDSPRTIKRYINIYRIIRTHRDFKYIQSDEHEYYCAAMILLSVMTGLPDISRGFYDVVGKTSDDVLFKDFLHEQYLKGDSPNQALKSIYDNISNDEYPGLAVLESLRMDKLKKNQHIISRFSFRNLSSF